MVEKIRTIQLGCGPIGCEVAKLALQRNYIQLVGAVDIDPQKEGQDLGQLLGIEKKLGMVITDNIEALLTQEKPDLVFHTTCSELNQVYAQLKLLLEAQVNVVSTCEELSFPYTKSPNLAAELNQLAKSNQVSLLATGINPGFLMDTWPLCMTAVCQHVQKIKVVRIQDASLRRMPFQKKIGAGLSPEEFQQQANQGTIRHVGLEESAAMIASGLGWDLSKITEEIHPVIAPEQLRTQQLDIPAGFAAGVKQVAHGYLEADEKITLEFQAFIKAPESYDAIYITGIPSLKVVIPGGVHGDLGTAAVVVNAASKVVNATAGLLTMKDIPLVNWTTGSTNLGI